MFSIPQAPGPRGPAIEQAELAAYRLAVGSDGSSDSSFCDDGEDTNEFDKLGSNYRGDQVVTHQPTTIPMRRHNYRQEVVAAPMTRCPTYFPRSPETPFSTTASSTCSNDESSESSFYDEDEVADELDKQDSNSGDDDTLRQQPATKPRRPHAHTQEVVTARCATNSPEAPISTQEKGVNMITPLRLHLLLPSGTQTGYRGALRPVPTNALPTSIVIDTIPQPSAGLTILSQPPGLSNLPMPITSHTPYDDLRRYIRRIANPFMSPLRQASLVMDQVWIVRVVCRGAGGTRDTSVVADKRAWDDFITAAIHTMIGPEGEVAVGRDAAMRYCPCGCGYRTEDVAEAGWAAGLGLPPLAIQLWLA